LSSFLGGRVTYRDGRTDMAAALAEAGERLRAKGAKPDKSLPGLSEQYFIPG
jgi:hypothetical protein